MSKKLNMAALNERTQQTKEELSKKENSVEKTVLIPINDIDFNEDNIFNLNDDDGSIEELAANIKENGLLHNIVVIRKSNGRYLLISGERRTKACILNGDAAIKANVVSDTSELGVLKKMFYANAKTREYSINEKIKIISAYEAKLALLAENGGIDVSAFRKDIAEAFGVNERQAIKLITINNGLSEKLKELLYSGVLNINEAASLAQLPKRYQTYASETLSAARTGHEAEAKADILALAKDVKKNALKSRKELSKIKSKETYIKKCIENLENELHSLSAPNGDVTEKINEQLRKYTKKLIETDKEYMNVKKMEDAELDAICKNADSKKRKNAAGKPKDAVGKEIADIENSLKKLRSLVQADELDVIEEQLQALKNRITDEK